MLLGANLEVAVHVRTIMGVDTFSRSHSSLEWRLLGLEDCPGELVKIGPFVIVIEGIVTYSRRKSRNCSFEDCKKWIVVVRSCSKLITNLVIKLFEIENVEPLIIQNLKDILGVHRVC